MADWQRFLRDDDEIDPPEEEILLGEEPPLVTPTLLEDLGRITSIFLVLFLIRILFFFVTLFRQSWLTDMVGYVNMDSIIIFSCSIWVAFSGRFTIGLAIIGVVAVLQILIIGGFLDRSMIDLSRTFATDAIAFSSGTLVALLFRRW